MGSRSIPDQIKRFVLTSLRSVPHLEALLLLRTTADMRWSPQEAARRLYVSAALAAEVLSDLRDAGFLAADPEAEDCFRYQPSTGELKGMVDQLAAVYARDLIALTELIHARGRMKEQQFADAFLLRND